MSVWGTFWAADGDDHADTCARWARVGLVWELADRPCTCGQPGAPIAYQGSHILPSESDPRGGGVQLAEVPGHITRDGRDDGPDDGVTPWPYLRLSVGREDTVLDEQTVAAMWRALGDWLMARRRVGEQR